MRRRSARLVAALVAGAAAVERLDPPQVEQRGLTLLDVPCAATEGKHTCACQIKCENPQRKLCQRGLDACRSTRGCAYSAGVPEYLTMKSVWADS